MERDDRTTRGGERAIGKEREQQTKERGGDKEGERERETPRNVGREMTERINAKCLIQRERGRED